MVSARHVSAAALAATVRPVTRPRPRHCPAAQYVDHLHDLNLHPQYLRARLRSYQAFKDRRPSLAGWFDEPLVERVGRLPGEAHHQPSYPLWFRARPSLMYLALHDYTTLDYPFTLAAGQLRVVDTAMSLGIDMGVSALVEEAAELGFNRRSAAAGDDLDGRPYCAAHRSADKWLAARRLTDVKSTVEQLELAVRNFGDRLAEHHPGIESGAEVSRDHCLEWIQYLGDTPSKMTGKPLGVISRKQRIFGLSQLFRETAAWEYDDVPGYALIAIADAPKAPQRVPRFIPDHELDQLMPVIEEIACPFQRAALLAVRRSGTRRDEIRRLPLDCLDRYPDGTPRLRLPARKTYKERMVPLHQDAADALQRLIDLRRTGRDKLFTGEQIRYLFVRHGKLLSGSYLFETSLQKASKTVGLVGPGGWKGKERGTVSAHRFRHTVGIQLAERGAKLHTIMKALGHSSVSMALVHAQVSDHEVLRDYKSVLEPAAVVAGPAAEELKSGTLPVEAVDWLKSDFLKTELELATACAYPPKVPASATSI
jgi:integrase